MNFRLTAILFGTTLVLGIVLLFLTLGDDKDAPTGLLLEELAAVKSDQITSVEMEREGGEKLKLVRVDKANWRVEEPYAAKADAAAVNEVVAALLRAKPVAHAGLSPNPAVHDLQPPGLKVTLRQGDERSATLGLGQVTVGEGGGVVFVTTSARPDRPLAVARSAVEPLFRGTGAVGKAVDFAKWAADFRVKQVFPGTRSAEDVSTVKLTAKGKTLALAQTGGAWKITEPGGMGDADTAGDSTPQPNTFTGVRPLLNALTSLQALAPADFVEKPTPEELAKYGLNDGNPSAVRAEIKSTTGETTVAFIGNKDAAGAPPVHGMPGGKVWVRVEGQPGVIRANAGDLGGLVPVIENPDPLRDRTLLDVVESRIDGLDLVVGGQATKLRRIGGEWKLYGGSGDPTPANPDAVKKILAALVERRTVKNFPAANAANFAPPEVKAEVKVWLDGFDAAGDPKAEPKEKTRPITLILGRKENDTIYVRRVQPDGTTSADFVLPEKVKAGADTVDLVGTLAKRRLDLLDPAIKSFGGTVASKLTVSGATAYDLDKDDKPDPSTGGDRWVFAGPPDRKGQTADADTVEKMLRDLGNAGKAERFVSEAPTAEELTKYGLAPNPRLKVVVGLKGTAPDDAKREYEFGNDAEPGFVYARQPGKPAVFTLSKALFDKFAAPDLRDRHLFRFDLSRVTGVEFKGWKKTSGFVTDLEFTKAANGTWEGKVRVNNGPPSPFAADAVKVEAFLRTLAQTSVKSFVAGDRTPEQGLDEGMHPAQAERLNVLVKIANDPGIHLVLGAGADGGAAYYGWTSRVAGGPVFTVDASRFKAYKDSPAAFAK